MESIAEPGTFIFTHPPVVFEGRLEAATSASLGAQA